MKARGKSFFSPFRGEAVNNKFLFAGGRHKRNGSYGELVEDPNAAPMTPKTNNKTGAAHAQNAAPVPGGAGAAGAAAPGVVPQGSKVTNTEKTLLLSSDDEFQ